MADRPFSMQRQTRCQMPSRRSPHGYRMRSHRFYPLGRIGRAGSRRSIEATLGRLELVPREDFDRQRQQLERLMRDVARLEARISALEPGNTPH